MLAVKYLEKFKFPANVCRLITGNIFISKRWNTCWEKSLLMCILTSHIAHLKYGTKSALPIKGSLRKRLHGLIFLSARVIIPVSLTPQFRKFLLMLFTFRYVYIVVMGFVIKKISISINTGSTIFTWNSSVLNGPLQTSK